MRKFISLVCDVVLTHPVVSTVILALLVYISVLQAGKLSINSNQIDLLPAEYPEVVQTKKVIEMVGGNGFFIIVLKAKDEMGMNDILTKAFEAKRNGNSDKYAELMNLAKETKEKNREYYSGLEKHIKKTADNINKRLLQESDVRYISYRYDTDFLQEKFPLLVMSEDVKETHNRIQKKIEREYDKLNMFVMDLGAEEEEIDFSDILKKYQKLAKRDIFDQYNISPDKTMLIMLVKPTGSFIDISFTRAFEAKVRSIIDEMGIQKDGTFVGYTGTYKLNLDDYDSLLNALKPVSIASLLGIIILLLVFFRNPIFIGILVVSLVVGVTITFGITGFAIGRLNTITSALAAVLMGLGIDYGIQFLYRFRQEFTIRNDFMSSVKETIYHTGMASLISACTTTSAFFVLMFSDFKGFSEFGYIACYGIIVIALSMYFVTALQIAVLFKFFPSLRSKFYHEPPLEVEVNYLHKIFANPNRILVSSGIVLLFLGFMALFVKFNYSGRDLLLEDQESLLLYDEIADRFEITSDPQVIVVETLEDSEAIFDYFNPVPPNAKESVDQIVSLWSVLPTKNQQKVNLFILNNIKNDIKPIKPEMLTEEQRKHYPKIMKYFSVKEYSLNDVPDFLKAPFKEVPGSKEKGHMLFVYPKIALWHGKDLMKFYDAVGQFEYPVISKRTLNSILHHHPLDYSKKENIADYSNAIFSHEEQEIILGKVNTASEKEFLKMGVLPLTAKFIIDHRPYHSIDELRRYTKSARTVGSVILFAKLAQIVQSESYLAIFATIGIVTVILVIFYRGLGPALISLVPLLLGLVCMMGFMGMTGFKINFMNILVFPIIIGYGIQNGIYMYFRFLEEKDIARTLIQVGPAIIASTLTTLVGWAVLLLAKHRGLHSIGVAASIGIASTLLVALILLPVLLEKFYGEADDEFTDKRSVGMNFDTPTEEVKETQFYEEMLELQESTEEKPVSDEAMILPKEESVRKKKPKVSKKKTSISKKSVSKKSVSKKKASSKKKK